MFWSQARRLAVLPSTINRVSKHFGFKSRFIPNNRFLDVHNFHSSSVLSADTGKVTVHFLFPDGNKTTVKAKEGSSILDVVNDHNVDIDGYGACEGTLSCSTCHIICKPDVYEKLPAVADEEMDMLDLAFGLTDTSRLGCQIVLTKELDGVEITVPAGLADARG
ncbi:adrenodoxin-like [Watersipora subatra]|uniref:adrenodoxin-like n=1 Tax=Watersipora subatra TaxID=2589382 RepID=UPI00355B19A2